MRISHYHIYALNPSPLLLETSCEPWMSFFLCQPLKTNFWLNNFRWGDILIKTHEHFNTQMSPPDRGIKLLDCFHSCLFTPHPFPSCALTASIKVCFVSYPSYYYVNIFWKALQKGKKSQKVSKAWKKTNLMVDPHLLHLPRKGQEEAQKGKFVLRRKEPEATEPCSLSEVHGWSWKADTFHFKKIFKSGND